MRWNVLNYVRLHLDILNAHIDSVGCNKSRALATENQTRTRVLEKNQVIAYLLKRHKPNKEVPKYTN